MYEEKLGVGKESVARVDHDAATPIFDANSCKRTITHSRPGFVSSQSSSSARRSWRVSMVTCGFIFPIHKSENHVSVSSIVDGPIPLILLAISSRIRILSVIHGASFISSQ